MSTWFASDVNDAAVNPGYMCLFELVFSFLLDMCISRSGIVELYDN